jgi:glutathione S-transferase
MKLLGSPGSPYARKVRIVLAEKRIAYDFQLIRLADPDPGIAPVNPLGKIPALIRDDGRAVYDSVVIVEYLDALAPVPKLIPEPLDDRIEVKRWEALANGILDAAVAISHDYILPELPNQGLVWSHANQQKKIDLGLAAMEKDLGTRAFCHGETFTLADIACGVALGYVDHVLPKVDWRPAHPNLRRLSERLDKRDSFIATRPAAAH